MGRPCRDGERSSWRSHCPCPCLVLPRLAPMWVRGQEGEPRSDWGGSLPAGRLLLAESLPNPGH